VTVIPEGLPPMQRDMELMRVMEAAEAASHMRAVYCTPATAGHVIELANAWGWTQAAWIVRVLAPERESWDGWPAMHAHLLIYAPERAVEWYYVPEDGLCGDVWQCDHTATPPAGFWERVLAAYCPPGEEGRVAAVNTGHAAWLSQVKDAVSRTGRKLHVV
jgi:hypothetical protein